MAQHLAFRRAIGWEMNTWITAHKNNGDRNISLLRRPERRNRINGKQIVTESCKVPVSIPSTNKKARHLTGAGFPSQREGEGRAGPHAEDGKGPRARRGAPPGENAPSRPAASWSPTGWTRSTIGARGLNFRVRDGTGCASPAMAAGRLGAFCLRGGPAVPWGPHSARKRRVPRDRPWEGHAEELGRLVPLG